MSQPLIRQDLAIRDQTNGVWRASGAVAVNRQTYDLGKWAICLFTLGAAAIRRIGLLGKHRTLGEDVNGWSFFFPLLLCRLRASSGFEVLWLSGVTGHGETLSYRQSEHPVKRLSWGASYRQ